MGDEKRPKIYGEVLISDYTEDPSRTILLVSHELSLSGAPVVLFNLSLALKKAGWQTLIISPKDGPLGSYAANHGVPAMYIPGLYGSGYTAENRKKFAAVIACTIVTAPVVTELNGTDTPVMWWIHESAASYSEDKSDDMPNKLSDNVHVYCGGAYAKRMLKERFPRYRSEVFLYYVKDTMRTDAALEAQLKTHEEGQRIFACIGMIEPRKGQDILLEAIRRPSGRSKEELPFYPCRDCC